MNFLFLLFSFILLNTHANACETGFACSIDNIRQLQNEQESIIYELLENIFDKKINEDLFFAHPFYSENYNDIFIFKSTL